MRSCCCSKARLPGIKSNLRASAKAPIKRRNLRLRKPVEKTEVGCWPPDVFANVRGLVIELSSLLRFLFAHRSNCMPVLPSISVSRSARLLAAVREAIGGARQDFTEGSLDRAIVLLAIPMV